MSSLKFAVSLAVLGAGCAGDFGVIDRPLSSVCYDVMPRGEQTWPGPFEVEVLWHWRGEGLPSDLDDRVGSAVANIQERLTVAWSSDEPIIVGALRGRRGLVALQARDGSLVNRVDTPMSKCAPAGERVACMNGMDLMFLDPVRDQEIIAERSEERYYIDSLAPGSSYAVGESLYIEGRYAEVAQMLGFPVTVFGADPYDAIVRSFDGTYYVSDLLEPESVNVEVSRTVNIPYTFSDYVGAVEFTETSISIVDNNSRVDIDTGSLILHDRLQSYYMQGGLCISDVNRDGMPDIVTMGSTVRGFVGGRHTWSLDLDDISTGGICYFVDLDGNGVEEVMLRTEAATLIVDGEGGEVLATWPATTGTAFDGPVLLDVNGDRSTEIVVNCTDEYREGSECRGVVAWTHPTGSLAWFGPRWDGILGPYHGMQADGSYVWPPPPFWEVPELNGLNRVPVRDHACPGLAPVLEEVCEREDGMIFVTISLANPGFFDLDEKVSLDVRDADNGARLASVLFDPPGHDQTSEARTVGPLASASGRIDIATRYDASSAYARCDNSKLVVSWEPP